MTDTLSARNVRDLIAPALNGVMQRSGEDTEDDDLAPAQPTAPRERPPFREGVHDNLPGDQYFPVEAIGSTALKMLVQKSAGHLRAEMDQPTPPTPAMVFGSAVHIGVLESHTFDARVMMMPAGLNLRTKADRATAAEFRAHAAAQGAITLSAADYARCLRTIDAVRAHPGAQRLMEGAVFERSLFWRDAKFGVPCRARWDVFKPTPRGAIVSDLKTCEDASPDGFGATVARMLYHAQAGHYTSGGQHLLPDVTITDFVFIAVESDGAHAVACYRVDEAAFMRGMAIADLAYSRYQEAQRTGRWGFYPDTIETLQMPRWALRG